MTELLTAEENLPQPPVAPLMPKMLEQHQDRREDPWYGLREKENQQVLDYLKSENAYTEEVMAHTDGLQGKLYDEMLGRIKETDESVPYKKGSYYYYSRSVEGKNYRILCRKNGSIEAPEEIILDENQRAEEKEFYDLGDWEISPNGRYMIICEDFEGDDVYRMQVLDLLTGETLSDSLEEVCGWGTVWAGNDYFFYVLMDASKRPIQVMRHKLGTPMEDDVEVYLEKDERFTAWIGQTQDDKYLVIGASNKNTSSMYILDINDPTGEFVEFQPRKEDTEYYVEHCDEGFIVMTNEDAKNFRVLLYPENSRDIEDAEELIAHNERIRIRATLPLKDYLIVLERNYGQDQIEVIDMRTREHHMIVMPDKVYMLSLGSNAEYETDKVRLSYESPITPSSVFDYDLNTRELALLKEREIPSGFDRTQYTVDRLWVPARDGMEIPVTIFYRKDVKLDGNAPMLVYGYGSYGYTIDPYFSSSRYSLIDRGFIYAIAHIRGGGMLGEDWYRNGKFLKKKNTFYDFIDVTEWLQAHKYSCPEKTTMMGGSAGGLLMGAVLNMRPDLYNVCVAQVPFVDVVTTMLDPSIPLTTMEYDEWGNPADKEYYDYMLSYSPYDNVKVQHYPNILVESGLNDARVQYWEPSKWVSKLRKVKIDDNRLLFKINMGAGHGGASGRYDYLKEIAFEYAFILDCYGIDQ